MLNVVLGNCIRYVISAFFASFLLWPTLERGMPYTVMRSDIFTNYKIGELGTYIYLYYYYHHDSAPICMMAEFSLSVLPSVCHVSDDKSRMEWHNKFKIGRQEV